MTLYADGLESGILGLTSAQSTRAGALIARERQFNAGAGNVTWSGFLPYDAIAVTASLYIMGQGAATQSDTLTISTSAGQTPLITFSQFGSAQGVLAGSVVGLGVRTIIASAAFRPAPATNPDGADIPFQVILSGTGTSPEYGLSMTFRRRFKPGT